MSLLLGINFQGDNVRMIDKSANDAIVDKLMTCSIVCAVLSEESKELISSNNLKNCGRYLVAIDPIDGSDNTEANITVGTIFSVYERNKSVLEKSVTADEFLRKGSEQIAAGYFLYGNHTSLVFTVGNGVHEFILDREIGEFILSRENMSIAEKSKYYSFNEGNYNIISESDRKFIDKLKSGTYTHRYAATLVADINRLINTGGIYLYPSNTNNPSGKLRLLYEANPISLILEQCQGKAVCGSMRVLDIEPGNIHQRTEFVGGSRENIDDYLRYRNEWIEDTN